MSLYLIGVLPPEQLSEEIEEIRQELSERFNIYAALKPPVHITLFRPLKLDEKLEKHLVKLLKPIGYNHYPFSQDLLNFDCFNIQTAFITAVKSSPLNDLQKEISGVINKNKIDVKDVKGNTTFHPHITVAYRDIPPEVFPLLWNELKNRKFKRSFMVDKFHLLKHNRKKWMPFEEFQLQKAQNLELF